MPFRQAWTLARCAAGGALLLAGVVMLVVPGPGLAALVAGLSLLAPHLEWAARAMLRVRTAWHAVRRRTGCARAPRSAGRTAA